MKAQELRIGNLYHYNMIDTQDERGKWKEVATVDILDLMHLNEHPDDPNFIPIPIDGEWVEKFGFDKPALSYIGKTIHITSYGKNNDMWMVALNKNNGILRTIKYVHELQNLYYAVTGEELTIKENKQ